MIDKELREEIQKRYGSFELSHDKNEIIVKDIYNFVLSEKKDIAIKFADWIWKNCDEEYMSVHTWESIFEEFLKTKQ